MKINNAVVEPVAIKWDNITLPLKEGTPISIGGNIANNGTAMGLVPVTVYNRPVASDRISILVSGDVDLAEVEKSFGSALETSAKAAMSGIRFHKKDGTIDDSADEKGSALPSVTADDNGDVLTVVSGAWAKATPSGGGGGGAFVITATEEDDVTTLDKTWQEIFDAVSDGQIAVIDFIGEATAFRAFVTAVEEDGSYYVTALGGDHNLIYTAETADGYPILDDGGGGGGGDVPS